MIIRSLTAENLSKYRRLRIEDLPERGIIAVSGDNETGKSAIGEIICFALFGRTYSLVPSQLGKLVRWGAGRGSVSLRFAVGARDYEVSRHLERDGEQSARLVACDQPDDVLARGADAVHAHLGRLLGYGFDAYIETFYLAQREITAPHPHNPAVRKIAGVVLMERCARDLSQETERDEESARQLEERIAAVDSQRALVGGDQPNTADIEKSLNRVEADQRVLASHMGNLGRAADAYFAACRGSSARALRRGIASLLSAVLLLAALVVGGIWLLLQYQPHLWPVPTLRSWLEGQLASTGYPLEVALVYGGIALGGLFVLVWLWGVALGLGARRRRARGRKLANELEQLDALEEIEGASQTELGGDALSPGDVSVEGGPLVDRPDSERRARLARRVLELGASPQEVRNAVQHEIAWMGKLGELLSDQHRKLAASFASAKDDLRRISHYDKERDELSEQLKHFRTQIATRRLACKLLDGAVQRMSDRFSGRLRSTLDRNLPRLTDGRYEHVQLDEGLQVRVYSADKRNYLELEEISSGTQRQTLLALRLALAQELVMRVVRDRQFTFLDEPFAFFDGSRMRNALKLLTTLGDDVVQHWVVAQRFPQDAPLALQLACGEHPDTLEFCRPENR